jgi:outer membrane receptor protein involved in Fe transport
MVDIARVEALAGPQGTLYGSDAQAGTLRIITNKPVMNETEVIFDGEFRGGSDSDASYNGSLVFNIPVMEDKLALRVAAYSDHDGGFIDNVLGYTADTNALLGTKFTQQYGTLSNAHAVEKNWNTDQTNGYRAKLRWDMNDSWSATLTGQMQHVKATGDSNAHNPYVGKRQIVKFVDSHNKQNFKAYDLLIEGDLGFADLVSSTNYYKYAHSGVDGITDYAHYWSSVYCADSGIYAKAATYVDTDAASTTYQDAMPYYYANPKTGYLGYFPRYCQGTDIDSDFYSTAQNIDQNTTVSQEFRLSNQGDRIDWIVGMFMQGSTNSWIANYAVPTDGINDASLWSTSYAASYYKHNFGERGIPFPSKATSNWHSEQRSKWNQTAFFGEVAFRFTDDLTLTLGARNFKRTNESAYYVDHPGSNYSFGQTPYGVMDGDIDKEHRDANNGRPTNYKGEDKITIPKISLKYNLSDDSMAYALYTKGERPGGTNRSRGEPFFPGIYQPDVMSNFETGLRSTFGDGRGRLNVTAYFMKWDKYQLELVDPSSTKCDANGDIAAISGLDNSTTVKVAKVCGQPWQNLVANVGDAHINGINVDLEYALTQNITFGVNYEKMEAMTDTNHSLDNETPDTYEIKKDMRLPMVPEHKGSFWATWSAPTTMAGATNKFVRFQASTQGGSFNKLEEDSLNSSANPQYYVPGYTLMDMRAGLQGENWELTAFVDNLTDEVATYTRTQGDFGWAQASSKGRAHTVHDWISRPREIGIRFMRRWGD